MIVLNPGEKLPKNAPVWDENNRFRVILHQSGELSVAMWRLDDGCVTATQETLYMTGWQTEPLYLALDNDPVRFGWWFDGKYQGPNWADIAQYYPGEKAAALHLQPDGHLVLYSDKGSVFWSTGKFFSNENEKRNVVPPSALIIKVDTPLETNQGTEIENKTNSHAVLMGSDRSEILQPNGALAIRIPKSPQGTLQFALKSYEAKIDQENSASIREHIVVHPDAGTSKITITGSVNDGLKLTSGPVIGQTTTYECHTTPLKGKYPKKVD